MPVRTRSDMHIGLDLILNVLNATPSNRLDPAVKDYFLNRTISEFIKSEVDKTNKPDESKRVPFRILTYGDIINKYNNLYTLIKVDDTLRPLAITDNNFYQYTLPSDLSRFEGSFCNVRPLECITYPSATKPTVANSSGAGTVDAGVHYYVVTFVYPTLETDINGVNVASITITTSKNAELTAIPLGLTGCTARKIYRTKVSDPWYKLYYVGTLSGNTTTTYTDSATDASLTVLYSGNLNDTQLTNPLLNTYDIIGFNNNPYGGKRKYIGTIIDNTGLKLYHLQRYAISKVGVIYLKKPAILTSSPTPVDCDLPESVHDNIVEDTAKFISAAVNSGNYQQLLMEAKQKV
jgi:hypothetical protein